MVGAVYHDDMNRNCTRRNMKPRKPPWMMMLLLVRLLLHPDAPYYLLRHVCMFCFFHIRGRRSSSAQIFVQELKFG